MLSLFAFTVKSALHLQCNATNLHYNANLLHTIVKYLSNGKTINQMLKKIYNLLPPKWQEKTRNAWLQENDEEIRTFYNRLERPKFEDLKLFKNLWGLPYEELLMDVELTTIKLKEKPKTDVRYMMQVVDFMNEQKQLELL